MEDKEKITIAEFKDPQVIHNIAPYVKRYAPSSYHVIERLLHEEEINIKDMQNLLNELMLGVVPHFDKDHNLPDEMQDIKNLVVEIGSQL